MQPFPAATTTTAPSPRSSRNAQTENNIQHDMATVRRLYSTISIIHSVYYLSPNPPPPKKKKKNPTRQLETTQSSPCSIYVNAESSNV